MRVVKLIELTYANTQNATTYINVPFPVRTLTVKQLAYVNGDHTTGHTADYAHLTTDLVEGNQVLALFYRDRDLEAISHPNTTYEFLNPRNITGDFTFRMSKPTIHSGTDTIQLIIEFQD